MVLCTACAVEVSGLVVDEVGNVDNPKIEDRFVLLAFDGVCVSRLKSEAKLELFEFEELEPENMDSSVLLTKLFAF